LEFGLHPFTVLSAWVVEEIASGALADWGLGLLLGNEIDGVRDRRLSDNWRWPILDL
jgi:hypothetical protein